MTLNVGSSCLYLRNAKVKDMCHYPCFVQCWRMNSWLLVC